MRCLALINQRGGVCQSSLADFLYNTNAVVKHVKSHSLLPDSDKLGGEGRKKSTAIRRTVWHGLVCCYLVCRPDQGAECTAARVPLRHSARFDAELSTFADVNVCWRTVAGICSTRRYIDLKDYKTRRC